MNKNQIQQGDVCIEFIESLPRGAKKNPDKILKHGEVTGHKHTLVGDVDVLEFEGKKYFTVGRDGASLVHEEHGMLVLAPGQIGKMLDGVFEYDYESEEAKQVKD